VRPKFLAGRTDQTGWAGRAERSQVGYRQGMKAKQTTKEPGEHENQGSSGAMEYRDEMLEEKMNKMSITKTVEKSECGGSEDDTGGFTQDEAEALEKLLAADETVSGEDSTNGRGSERTDAVTTSTSEVSQVEVSNSGKPSVSDSQRHPRLERQVFVGGLPVDVTSSLFRTWADHVFNGRVINAVLVSWKSSLSALWYVSGRSPD